MWWVQVYHHETLWTVPWTVLWTPTLSGTSQSSVDTHRKSSVDTHRNLVDTHRKVPRFPWTPTETERWKPIVDTHVKINTFRGHPPKQHPPKQHNTETWTPTESYPKILTVFAALLWPKPHKPSGLRGTEVE